MTRAAELCRTLRNRRITLRAVAQGEDWVLTVSGGDRAHIGAAALAADGTCTVRERSGHREGDLAAEVAERVSSRLGCCVCATCGIHFDGISREEIDAVVKMVREMTDAWLEG